MKVRIFGKAALVLLFLCIIIFSCCAGCNKNEEDEFAALTVQEGAAVSAEDEEAADSDSTDMSAAEDSGGTIFVHVCGAVSVPGVYELKVGARVYEAIAAAGGMLEDAAEAGINQAQVLADSDQIYVPTEQEAAEGSTAVVTGAADAGGSGSGLVNINTADKEELKTLNGIGDTRADSIIAYREANGAFTKIEDLMLVDGIKEGTFEKLKDSITV